MAVNWTLLQRLKAQRSPPEIALLGLLEVVFGVLWAWLGAHEAPSVAVLGGGALVLLAPAGNAMLALRRAGRPARRSHLKF